MRQVGSTKIARVADLGRSGTQSVLLYCVGARRPHTPARSCKTGATGAPRPAKLPRPVQFQSCRSALERAGNELRHDQRSLPPAEVRGGGRQYSVHMNKACAGPSHGGTYDLDELKDALQRVARHRLLTRRELLTIAALVVVANVVPPLLKPPVGVFYASNLAFLIAAAAWIASAKRRFRAKVARFETLLSGVMPCPKCSYDGACNSAVCSECGAPLTLSVEDFVPNAEAIPGLLAIHDPVRALLALDRAITRAGRIYRWRVAIAALVAAVPVLVGAVFVGILDWTWMFGPIVLCIPLFPFAFSEALAYWLGKESQRQAAAAGQ